MAKRQSLCRIERLKKDEIPGICRAYHELTPKPVGAVEWGGSLRVAFRAPSCMPVHI